MSRRADFLKKVEPKPNRVTVDFTKVTQGTKQKKNSCQKNQMIRKQDITGFQFIGIFDKKVIVAYHNGLQLFGYFDFHAIHQRIRYEYYSNKLKRTRGGQSLFSNFDEQIIEKEDKHVRQLFGKQIKVLIQVSKSHAALFRQDEKKMEVWGIQLQRNTQNEVYITSFMPILGKAFSSSELICILQQEINQKGTKLPLLIDSWIAQYSCKSAYKFNDSFERSKAIMLIKNLSKCEFPWFCVHGRNTIHTSSSEQVSR